MSRPVVAKPAIEALGIRLRDLRRDAALTGRELAARCGWQPSKVSKLEYGKQTPSEADIRYWCIACCVPSEIPDLIAALRSIDAQILDWRRSLKAGTKRRQRGNVTAYEKTTLFRVWESAVVPGLLQTPDYARGVLTTIVDFYGIPDDVEEGVAARVEAQRVLTHGDRRFLLLIGEAVLHTRRRHTSSSNTTCRQLLSQTGVKATTFGTLCRSWESRQDAPDHLAEADHRAVQAGRRRGQRHGVPVLQKRPGTAVPERHRLGPAPGELHERAGLVARRPGHGAGGVEVTGAHRRAVRRQVGQLLRGRPVQPCERWPGHDRAVPHHLDADVVAGPVAGEVGQHRRVLHRSRHPRACQRVQRHDPRRHRRGE